MQYVSDETHTFDNLSETPPSFQMRGGLYGITAVATWDSGSVTLQRLSGDGTYVNVLALSENDYATVYVPYGIYRLFVDAEALYVEIESIAAGG